MKKYIYLALFLLGTLLSIWQTHANVDYVRSNLITYSCDSTNGIGTLRIVFWGGWWTVLHHQDTRYYHINHAWWVTINNSDPRLATGNIPPGTFYIPGCTRLDTCTTTNELTGPTNYSPVAGNQLKYRYESNVLDSCVHNYTYPANFNDRTYNVAISWNSLNYWPINSGPSNRDWSWWIVKNVTIRWSERDSRGRWYCDNNQGTATARYATTVVTLIPWPNWWLPDTRSPTYYNYLNQERALVAINPYTWMQFGTGNIFANQPAITQLAILRTALATKPTSICELRASCDTTVANNTLRTTTLDATGARCSQWSPTNFVSTTDADGKTTYTWTCQRTWAPAVSCNAYYKPLQPATVEDGQCEERYSINDSRNPLRHPPRLPDQCQYSVIMNQPRIGMTGGILSTQDGPTVVALTWWYLRSTNGVVWNCEPPVNGRPRVVCSADSFVNITGTLSWFTLPSSITQSIWSCRVIFDAADVCRPREDVIATRAIVPDCDPTIRDYNNPRYCPTSVEPVCVQLQDRFWNPILGYSTGRIVSRFSGSTLINRYFEMYNSGSDTTRYNEWSYTEVNGSYCSPGVCTVVNGVLCGQWCPGEWSATCNPVIPPESNPPPTICVNTPEEPNKCPVVTNTCIPTEANNFCNPPVPVTVPGCDSPSYSGDPMLCIDRPKACTAHLEVADELGWWTDNGDNIMYDDSMTYRIVVDGTDPACRNGTISVRSVTATGWTFSGSVTWSSTGAFTATIIRDNSSTPKSPRGPVVSAVYTQPGGISYGLTARADDFQDTPLFITGERMKGVRIIGAAGTNITSFNLNNAGVIWEDSGANTVTMRNAILRNVGLLTRGITYTDLNSARVINEVFYVEWDFTYDQLRNAMSGDLARTIIVRGNLTIDPSIPNKDTTDPIMGLITVRRADGSGGNVIVQNSVTSMRALIFAEGSFYGETQTFGNVPLTKLVLKWSLFSRNTIGGSADPENLYVSGGATTTDIVLAFMQDLNNVRNWYGCPAWGPECYKNYPDPFIIDYENTLGDPPPGFTL